MCICVDFRVLKSPANVGYQNINLTLLPSQHPREHGECESLRACDQHLSLENTCLIMQVSKLSAYTYMFPYTPMAIMTYPFPSFSPLLLRPTYYCLTPMEQVSKANNPPSPSSPTIRFLRENTPKRHFEHLLLDLLESDLREVPLKLISHDPRQSCCSNRRVEIIAPLP